MNISRTFTLNLQAGDDDNFDGIASIGSFDDESDNMLGESGSATLVSGL